MPPTKHARLGASGSKRWMACPGSVAASTGKENRGSKYTREGTAAHELGEMCLREGKAAEEYVGTIIDIEEEEGSFAIQVTAEMAEAVQVYVDHCVQAVQDAGPEAVVFIEQQFDLGPLSPPEDMFGTSDFAVWDPATRHLRVTDYKHGQGVVVEAHNNSQLWMYALGSVVELGKRPDTITVEIVQPRAFHESGPVRSQVEDWAYLVQFKKELFAAAEATQAEDAPRVAGDHCKFCPASASCPAQRDLAVAVAQVEFADLETELDLPSTDDLSIAEMAEIMEKGEHVIQWLKGIGAHLEHLADIGEDIPGFKLVEGRRGNRTWVDSEKAGKYLARKKIKADRRFKKVLVSPTQAEKLLKEDGHGNLPTRFWKQSEGKPKLVPESDPRPALAPSAESDFAAFIEPPTQEENDG